MIRVEHELHRRRSSRNRGLLMVLIGFAAIIFGLTIAKVGGGDSMKAFDHRLDNAMLPPAGDAAMPAAAAVVPAPAVAPAPPGGAAP